MAKLPAANKNLGQHYLKDRQIITKICQDFALQAGSIVEIGPGPGILTRELVTHQRPTIVIEKDPRFLGHLQALLPPAQIFIADALTCPLQELLAQQHTPAPIWLVSNLPYNVSVPLLVRFLHIPAIVYLTLMFQQEVAEKILPSPHQKNTTNSLMCLMQNYFQINFLAKARPGAFLPPPQVHSSILSFTRHLSPVIPLAQYPSYETFLRLLFAWRRKQMGKILATAYPSLPVSSLLSAQGIPPQARAETLTLEQVRLLYQQLHY